MREKSKKQKTFSVKYSRRNKDGLHLAVIIENGKPVAAYADKEFYKLEKKVNVWIKKARRIFK